MRSLNQYLEHAVDEGKFPGIALCITQDSDIIYEKEYGYEDLAAKRPMTSDTICRIYSMTKPITAASVSLLLERGLVDAEEDISAYLPEFSDMTVCSNGRIRPATQKIKIKHLLNMTSGIVYPDPDPVGQQMESIFEDIQTKIMNRHELSTAEVIKRIASCPLAFEPGSSWRYGFSADVLGHVIEVASGMKLSDFLKKEFFEPLEMSDTAFYVPKEKENRLSSLYKKTETGFQVDPDRHLGLTMGDHLPGFLSGGAGLYSTLSDYAKFLTMLQNGGMYKNTRILSAASVKRFTLNQLTEAQRHSEFYFDNMKGYGYGNLMRVYMDPEQALSAGSIGEFGWEGWTGPYCLVNPDKKFSAVFMIQVSAFLDDEFVQGLRDRVYQLIK